LKIGEKGGPIVLAMRKQFSIFSLKHAAIRIQEQKLKQLLINPIEEEDLMEQSMKKFENFESTKI